jgi:hypothetical protein
MRRALGALLLAGSLVLGLVSSFAAGAASGVADVTSRTSITFTLAPLRTKKGEESQRHVVSRWDITLLVAAATAALAWWAFRRARARRGAGR